MNTIIDHNADLVGPYLPECQQVSVSLGSTPLRVMRYSHFDEPMALVHASLPPGQHKLSLKIKRKYTQLRLHSCHEGFRIIEDVGKSLSKCSEIEVPAVGSAILECDGFGYLFLCFDPPETSPEGEGVLRADALGLHPEPELPQTEQIQLALNRISTSADLHTLVLSAGIYRSGDLNFPSNVRLHLDSGAVLLAANDAALLGDKSLAGWHVDRATFLHARDGENIAITGHGHIDGNRRRLDIAGYYKGMAVFRGCRNLEIRGVVLSDPCGWNFTPRHCEDVTIQRVKVINNRPRWSCINTDGINPDGCRNVLIEDAVMHTGDDAVAVKVSDYGSVTQDCHDITVRNLLAVNNSATAKVGTETRGHSIKRIRFENIFAVHTARLCVIESFDEAIIEEVTFENVRATSLHRWPGEPAKVVDIRTPTEAFRPIHGGGQVRGIHLDGILSDEDAPIVFQGADAERGVHDIHWGRVEVAGRRIRWEDLDTDLFVSGKDTSDNA